MSTKIHQPIVTTQYKIFFKHLIIFLRKNIFFNSLKIIIFNLFNVLNVFKKYNFLYLIYSLYLFYMVVLIFCIFNLWWIILEESVRIGGGEFGLSWFLLQSCVWCGNCCIINYLQTINEKTETLSSSLVVICVTMQTKFLNIYSFIVNLLLIFGIGLERSWIFTIGPWLGRS